jgi:hypothetical protein
MWSFYSQSKIGLQGAPESTPLQLKLNDLAELIAKLGSAAGLLLFAALMIRFFVQLGTGEPQRTASQKGLAFVQILIISVTLVVVAVPEGPWISTVHKSAFERRGFIRLAAGGNSCTRICYQANDEGELTCSHPWFL